MAGDLLHDGHGALAHERGGHRVGADAWDATQRAAWEALKRSGGKQPMMQPVRRVSTLAVTALLAWVLWRQGAAVVREGDRTMTSSDNWQVETAVEDRGQCNEALTARLRGLMGRRQVEGQIFDAVYRAPSTVIWTAEDGSTEIVHRLVCLPDTVDPRGPKGR
jgi:hypothetical protein